MKTGWDYHVNFHSGSDHYCHCISLLSPSPRKPMNMSVINIPLSRYISKKIKQLWDLPTLARKLNLSLTKEESLHNLLIGLDRIKRKLLLIRKVKGQFDCCVVDLNDVQHCSVKKVYGSIKPGDLQKKGLGYYLQSISLQVIFKNGAEPIAVNFYESRHHSIKQQSFLESSAKKWVQFVSELVPKPVALA